ARIASITAEEGRIVLRLGREDAALAARLQSKFKDRVRVSRDRAWLAFESDPKWREHLSAVVSAMTERKD
ncbi:MAG: hypothetical protein L0Y55_08560, partial [Anaerolineales bacterium]|nr:hypothetical protein [Anaerolineales bacterium]